MTATCPHCSAKLGMKNFTPGKAIVCPKCQGVFSPEVASNTVGWQWSAGTGFLVLVSLHTFLAGYTLHSDVSLLFAGAILGAAAGCWGVVALAKEEGGLTWAVGLASIALGCLGLATLCVLAYSGWRQPEPPEVPTLRRMR